MIITKNVDCYQEILKIPEKAIDLILTDPCFGTTKHEWDKSMNWEFLFDQFKRLCKPNSAIVLFSQEPFTSSLINNFEKQYKHFWIWNKKQSANFAVAKYMPLTVTETIVVFSPNGERVTYYPQMVTGKKRKRGSKNAKTNGSGFGNIKQVYYESDQYYPTNLLDFKGVARKDSLHPSQKPVELLEYLIKTYSKPKDIVFDFTAGSFSTAIAAINTGRKFIGFELNKNYYDIGLNRINELQGSIV